MRSSDTPNEHTFPTRLPDHLNCGRHCDKPPNPGRPWRRRLTATALLVTAWANCAAQEAAPEHIEEVIVTAVFRDRAALAYDGSSTVLGQRDAQRRAAVHLENLLLRAPNVNIAGGSSRARFIQLRGIGERSQFVEPLNPSVGLLVDDIDFSGLGTAATLWDMDQVEVLRGPQGTLHGANALAGLIAMRSAAPTEEFSARLRAAAGNYRRRELGAAVSGPLMDRQLLGRVALYQHRSDGFIRNDFLQRDDTNERDETLFRGRLRWLPTERQQVDLTLLNVDVDNGYDAFSLDNTRHTLSDQPGRDTQRSRAAALHWQQDGDRVRGELFASAADTNSEYSYDEDWSFPGIAPLLEYASFDRFLRSRRSYSAQLRLSSSQPLELGSYRLDWVGGLYWLDDDEALLREYSFASADFHSRFQAQTRALYGQADLDLGSGWQLGLGLRLASRDMDYNDNNGVDGDPDDELWGGKLSLAYEHSDLGYFYAAVSRGYRAGGVNAGILAFPRDSISDPQRLDGREFFDAELLHNFELGHKRSFAGGRGSSALTLFYMDREDQQVRGSLVLPRGDGSTAFLDFTDNAASGRNLGLEWELRWRASHRVDGYVNIGLLRALFDDYLNADGRDLGDREQAHAPRYQFASGITFRPLQQWSLSLEFEGRDGFFFSDRHDARAKRFELLHSTLSYEHKAWRFSLWGRNLLDEEYSIRGFGSFGNDPRKGYVVEEYRQFGDPRQFGLSVDMAL